MRTNRLSTLHRQTLIFWVSVALIGLGIYLLAPSSSPAIYTQSMNSSTVAQSATSAVTFEVPQSIALGSNVMPVEIGQYSSGTQEWTLSDTSAYIMQLPSGTTLPVFYAHATDSMFGPIHSMSEGDTIQLSYGTSTEEYRLIGRHTVSPDATSVLDSIPTGQIALISCSGLWSEQRVIAYFESSSANETKGKI